MNTGNFAENRNTDLRHEVRLVLYTVVRKVDHKDQSCGKHHAKQRAEQHHVAYIRETGVVLRLRFAERIAAPALENAADQIGRNLDHLVADQRRHLRIGAFD